LYFCSFSDLSSPQYLNLDDAPAFNLKESMADHVLRDRETELQRSRKLSVADRKKAAKLQGSKTSSANSGKGKSGKKTKTKRSKVNEDEEEQHYWAEQDEIDEEDESHSRLRDAQRDAEGEGDEDSEVSGVALALLQPRSASKRAWKKSKKLQDEESEKVEESEPVSIPPHKKQSKSKLIFFDSIFVFNVTISSESDSAVVKSVTKSRVRHVAVNSIPAPSPAESDLFDSHPDKDTATLSLLTKEWEKTKKPLLHLSTEVVDSYKDLLMQSPDTPKDVIALDSLSWYLMMDQIKDEKEFDARLKTFKGKRFVGKSRLLWVVYGFSHFAVLDISLTDRVIKVYDSIPKIAKKWVTDRLHRLLRSVAGGKDDFRVEVKKCAEQVNCDDCGVYAMANMRLLLFGRPVTHKLMAGKHMGDARRESAVAELRLKFFNEYMGKKLSKWL